MLQFKQSGRILPAQSHASYTHRGI